jgi:tRNA G18 (ribose-2'-O)-methylase SpoU
VIHHATVGDPGLDPYRHVGDATWLAERRLFVAEGRLVVDRLLASSDYELESIAVTPTAFEALSSRLMSASCDVYICERSVLEMVTGFNFHRGCLAIARRPQPLPATALFGARRLVGLEGVGNPDNIGGIFRTTAALGADGVVLDATCGDPLYRKAIRTSMGASLRLPWVRVGRFPQALEAFKAEGFKVIALTPDATAVSIDEWASTVTSSDRLMFILGSEGAGLPYPTLRFADARVRIPVVQTHDSLNVTVAAGIALERMRIR